MKIGQLGAELLLFEIQKAKNSNSNSSASNCPMLFLKIPLKSCQKILFSGFFKIKIEQFTAKILLLNFEQI
jgi:hypothetical protein